MSKIRICDICRKVIGKDERVIKFKVTEWLKDNTGEYQKFKNKFDMCNMCGMKFAKYIKENRGDAE